jgi:N-acetylneuraminic acid mutarotase
MLCCMTHFIAIHKCIWFGILIDRSEIAGALLNNKIYIIEVFENGHSTDIVQVYDPIKDEWSTLAPLSQPLDHTFVATSINGKLYVIGGSYLDRNVLSSRSYMIMLLIDGAKEQIFYKLVVH